jgi:hypothetical protein
MIPGAYERIPVSVRQPGGMGGSAFGSDVPTGATTMAAETIIEREKEGGGGASQRGGGRRRA